MFQREALEIFFSTVAIQLENCSAKEALNSLCLCV